jgi:Zn-finger nucleic acid-binding protein
MIAVPMCPKCRDHMDQHEARGHYGTRLFMFQCPECFGIWLDGETVGAISHDSAIEAEVDVDFGEISTVPRTIGIFCPRCEINLVEQVGGGLPEGLHIDYCTSCNGYWFDRGELMIYKSHIENKRKALKDQEDKKRAKALAPRAARGPEGKVLRFLTRELEPWRTTRLPKYRSD